MSIFIQGGHIQCVVFQVWFSKTDYFSCRTDDPVVGEKPERGVPFDKVIREFIDLVGIDEINLKFDHFFPGFWEVWTGPKPDGLLQVMGFFNRSCNLFSVFICDRPWTFPAHKLAVTVTQQGDFFQLLLCIRLVQPSVEPDKRRVVGIVVFIRPVA